MLNQSPTDCQDFVSEQQEQDRYSIEMTIFKKLLNVFITVADDLGELDSICS